MIGDPDMGFAALRGFGPDLLSHVKLKVRSDLRTNSVMLIDSPGMIDSPIERLPQQQQQHQQEGIRAGFSVPQPTGTLSELLYDSEAQKRSFAGRGYAFPEVIRWFASRADVILLFFDPEKPGTTGETLEVMTKALGR